MTGFVYAIKCYPTGKMYVGQTYQSDFVRGKRKQPHNDLIFISKSSLR